MFYIVSFLFFIKKIIYLKKEMNILLQAILIGIILGLMLIPITYMISPLAAFITTKPTLDEICKQWNMHYIMEVSLFLAGFVAGFILTITQGILRR